ncbi:MAG TPA: M1 family metallopeptidase, partial [Parvularculaceae bacterium]|nr:M1 family metallopeptidase [Parvularculaceae bacterium]
ASQASAAPEQSAAVSEAPRAPIGDEFTYANYMDARVTNADLDLTIDFDKHVIDGVATLDFLRAKAGAPVLDLDTNGLTIKSVETNSGGDQWTMANYTLGPADPRKGSKLEIDIPEVATKVRIAYETSPEAGGLQWLDPAQTADKKTPFVYSQNEEIQARTMAPLQDTPAVRMTYTATIHTPPGLVAVMSAAHGEASRDGEYHFNMPEKIPSYLIALAVGDIAFKAISDNVGVYAEPSVVDAAAKEFEDAPQMVRETEALYGPYRWGRYDMLILPPSFPFGGMENPRLTFLTPTLIAGDKSLVDTVAHELAHSWSGNLVTNATWRDSWLNEGVTSYVENRVVERVYGRERALMEQVLSLDTLKKAVADTARPEELAQLKITGRFDNPDEAFSEVPYKKGEFFLMFLEKRFGRDVFDAFLKSYFDHFAFQPITTEDFVAYLKANLAAAHPGVVSDDEINEWVYRPGIPDSLAVPHSDAFDKIDATLADWKTGKIAAKDIDASQWSALEFLHFVGRLPDDMTTDRMADLDAVFHFTGANNAEIAFAWYMKAVKAGYEPTAPAIKTFLIKVGRGKFINPLYRALVANGRKDFAKEIYAEARAGYHPISQNRIDKILE